MRTYRFFVFNLFAIEFCVYFIYFFSGILGDSCSTDPDCASRGYGVDPPLVGVDFFEGIKGVGSKTALKLIREHQTLESIIDKGIEVRKTKIADIIDIENLHTIQNIFLKPNVTLDYPKIRWRAPNSEKIREILVETHNFSKDRIEAGLKRLKKKGTARQKTLGDFF